MIMKSLRYIALRTIKEKARELHKTGANIEQIVDKLMAEPKIVEGLNAIDVDREELIKIIEKETNS